MPEVIAGIDLNDVGEALREGKGARETNQEAVVEFAPRPAAPTTESDKTPEKDRKQEKWIQAVTTFLTSAGVDVSGADWSEALAESARQFQGFDKANKKEAITEAYGWLIGWLDSPQPLSLGDTVLHLIAIFSQATSLRTKAEKEMIDSFASELQKVYAAETQTADSATGLGQPLSGARSEAGRPTEDSVISSEQLLRPVEVIKALDIPVSATTLLRWSIRFSEFLDRLANEGYYSRYSQRDLETLRQIQASLYEGLTYEEVAEQLKVGQARGEAPSSTTSAPASAEAAEPLPDSVESASSQELHEQVLTLLQLFLSNGEGVFERVEADKVQFVAETLVNKISPENLLLLVDGEIDTVTLDQLGLNVPQVREFIKIIWNRYGGGGGMIDNRLRGGNPSISPSMTMGQLRERLMLDGYLQAQDANFSLLKSRLVSSIGKVLFEGQEPTYDDEYLVRVIVENISASILASESPTRWSDNIKLFRDLLTIEEPLNASVLLQRLGLTARGWSELSQVIARYHPTGQDVEFNFTYTDQATLGDLRTALRTQGFITDRSDGVKDGASGQTAQENSASTVEGAPQPFDAQAVVRQLATDVFTPQLSRENTSPENLAAIVRVAYRGVVANPVEFGHAYALALTVNQSTFFESRDKLFDHESTLEAVIIPLMYPITQLIAKDEFYLAEGADWQTGHEHFAHVVTELHRIISERQSQVETTYEFNANVLAEVFADHLFAPNLVTEDVSVDDMVEFVYVTYSDIVKDVRAFHLAYRRALVDDMTTFSDCVEMLYDPEADITRFINRLKLLINEDEIELAEGADWQTGHERFAQVVTELHRIISERQRQAEIVEDEKVNQSRTSRTLGRIRGQIVSALRKIQGAPVATSSAGTKPAVVEDEAPSVDPKPQHQPSGSAVEEGVAADTEKQKAPTPRQRFDNWWVKQDLTQVGRILRGAPERWKQQIFGDSITGAFNIRSISNMVDKRDEPYLPAETSAVEEEPEQKPLELTAEGLIQRRQRVYDEKFAQNPYFVDSLNVGLVDLAGKVLRDCDLQGLEPAPGSYFEGSEFIRVDMQNCELRGCNFRLAIFGDSNLSSTALTSSNLEQARFRGGVFDRTRFDNANLGGSNFNNLTLRGCSFVGANLKDATFTNVRFENVMMSYQQILDLSINFEPGVKKAMIGQYMRRKAQLAMGEGYKESRAVFPFTYPGKSVHYDDVEVGKVETSVTNPVRESWKTYNVARRNGGKKTDKIQQQTETGYAERSSISEHGVMVEALANFESTRADLVALVRRASAEGGEAVSQDERRSVAKAHDEAMKKLRSALNTATPRDSAQLNLADTAFVQNCTERLARDRMILMDRTFGGIEGFGPVPLKRYELRNTLITSPIDESTIEPLSVERWMTEMDRALTEGVRKLFGDYNQHKDTKEAVAHLRELQRQVDLVVSNHHQLSELTEETLKNEQVFELLRKVAGIDAILSS